MSDACLTNPTLDDTLATHVLDVLLAGNRTDPTADRSRPRVLEVAQVFGDAVVDLKHFTSTKAVSLGDGVVRSLRGTRSREDFFVPQSLLGEAAHTLFSHTGEGWEVAIAPEWEGYVEGPAGRRPFAAIAAFLPVSADGRIHVPLGAEDHAVVQIGATTFVGRSVHPSRRLVAKLMESIDYPMLGITGFMAFVAALLGVAVAYVPPPPEHSAMNDGGEGIEITLDRVPKLAPAKPEAGPEGAQAKGPEGKRGDEHPDPKAKPTAMAKKASDADIAKASGVLGALDDNQELAAMLGESGLSGNLQAGVGSLIGARASQIGVGGLGERNGGIGGNGTAEFMDSWGPGKRPGKGPGCDGALCGGGGITKSVGNSVRIDDGGIVLGSMDKALIDAVIKRNMAQIRYCYQRELNKNPSLSGKVTVKFVIAGDGSVSTATTKTSTLGSPAAESCINGRFMRFAFPEPKGNGIVIVSYPFLFSPG